MVPDRSVASAERVRFGDPGFIRRNEVALYAAFLGAPPGDKFLRIYWDHVNKPTEFQIVDTQAGEVRRDNDKLFDIEEIVEHTYEDLSGPTERTVRVELIHAPSVLHRTRGALPTRAELFFNVFSTDRALPRRRRLGALVPRILFDEFHGLLEIGLFDDPHRRRVRNMGSRAPSIICVERRGCDALGFQQVREQMCIRRVTSGVNSFHELSLNQLPLGPEAWIRRATVESTRVLTAGRLRSWRG